MQKLLKSIHTPLGSGLVLAGINLGAILIAFAVWKMSGLHGLQIWVQAPLAAIFTVLGWAIWQRIILRNFKPDAPANTLKDQLTILVAASLFAALIFYGLHYASQGYLAKFSNVLAIWLFQLPTNLCTLLLINVPPARILHTL